MANLQYGDTVIFDTAFPTFIKGITDVAPIKYDSINEQWTVVAQKDATHMLITMENTGGNTEYILIEIGKCENLYLLADAIVE